MEPGGELRATHAPGEAHDPHRAIAWSIARVRGPPCGPTRSRSASVSTSSTRFGRARPSHVRPSAAACARNRASAPRPVERREHLGDRQPEGVRRPVRGLDDRDPTEAGGHRKSTQVGRAHARQIGVHDETDPVRACECGGHGYPLPLAGIVQGLCAELDGDEPPRRVVGHDPCVSHPYRRLDHVTEHRKGDVGADLGRETALAAGAKRDDDDARPEGTRGRTARSGVRRRAERRPSRPRGLSTTTPSPRTSACPPVLRRRRGACGRH